ncbi:hypothetical protein PHET_04644 [Paragonimus heterotremus]|uniref:Uncharacterized protein n=1 Tax=Paragonimus heterotremus TaxID=100268 RepID=A0A8J4T923_9TREM|nr:hypothetical protein PHET_04644 [Paragonimus heterotremus]
MVEQFDFCPQSVPKAFSVAATVILGLAIVLGGVSVGLPEFLRVEPTIRNDTSGLNDSFNFGYSQLCYDSTGCEQLPTVADGDEVFNRLTNLRLSAYGLHLCALSLSGLVLIGCIVVLALWFPHGNDNWPFRLSRLILGIVLMLSGRLFEH